ncbi:MAG: hypothetical protein R3270_12005, partial [Gammaproteobacteria bacterium]|nr:hypothetical protein [Gammaproteobacteria bacterium]
LWQFRESSDTYTELIASGKSHHFGDSELRSEVAQYYRETEVLLRYWLDVTDYRDLVRRYLPYDIQLTIQQRCEVFVAAARETRANALVADCDPPLSATDVERGVKSLLGGVAADELRASANRRVAQINIHLDQYARKRESAVALVEVLEAAASR